MQSLSEAQRAIVSRLTERLVAVPGLEALVLGGSHARGRARPDSDVDLGLYYDDAHPLDIEALREIARDVSDVPDASVTELWEWGPWVNGGAWLVIEGHPVDLLYRSLDQQSGTIDAASRGEYELHFAQQPPFGFFGPTCLGEIDVAIVLADPRDRLSPLKARVADYPEALRRRVIADFLWSAEFALQAFARKAAHRAEPYVTTAVLARIAHALTLTLFALNRRYLLNDKTAAVEIDAFPTRPENFAARLHAILGATGTDTARLEASVESMGALVYETIDLAGDLYTPAFRLRGA